MAICSPALARQSAKEASLALESTQACPAASKLGLPDSPIVGRIQFGSSAKLTGDAAEVSEKWNDGAEFDGGDGTVGTVIHTVRNREAHETLVQFVTDDDLPETSPAITAMVGANVPIAEAPAMRANAVRRETI